MFTLLFLINSIRLTPLVEDAFLDKAATARAEIVYYNFSHEGIKDSFKGTICNHVGENLARYFWNDWQVHQAFMNSPSHKAVILDEKYKSMGVGRYGPVVVEIFCDKEQVTL